MGRHAPAYAETAGARPVFRIALPAWSLRGRALDEADPEGDASRDEFKRLLDGALSPNDLIVRPMTRAERRQAAITRKVRAALYG